ncbi:phosphodiester glycosidase family protein [candidate division WWE3 bacterium]|uniref:Phosphodiester glycosidase family protein n=1 Tax=candidate division WWE3 bacterium TaxID=2053526 RepID=A0A955J1U2_UNCKA|nr:phosphodiester glycosidase family protein [candidate division WWE3 bacterium]
MQRVTAKLAHFTPYVVLLLTVVVTTIATIGTYKIVGIESSIKKLDSQLTEQQETYKYLNDNLPKELFEDHLSHIENITLKNSLADTQTELDTLKSDETQIENNLIQEVYEQYDTYNTKLARNTKLKLNTDNATSNVEEYGALLLAKDYVKLKELLDTNLQQLDKDYNEYIASLPPPATSASGGYSYTNVNTEKGTFGVFLIKLPKDQITIKTLAAIDNDCKNNCPTKSLAQYVKENNAYAGITGSYACPADYAQCQNKLWSFDFALYDSNDNKWLNKKARGWSETGLMTFKGGSSNFYKKSTDYGGDSVTAAISNFPSLVKDNNIVVDKSDTDSYQETKGLRGAIGTDDKNVYLAYITNATVIDAAYAMRALGAKDALNMDGGGTAAMYIDGRYVVGPGRPLANAIVIVK